MSPCHDCLHAFSYLSSWYVRSPSTDSELDNIASPFHTRTDAASSTGVSHDLTGYRSRCALNYTRRRVGCDDPFFPTSAFMIIVTMQGASMSSWMWSLLLVHLFSMTLTMTWVLLDVVANGCSIVFFA